VKKAVLIMGSIAMFIFMEPIFEGLAEFFSFNYVLEEKFTSMYLALKYDDVEMVGSRPELLFKAFIDWTENPIFGGKHTDQNSHSFIMTYLVNSGVIGFSVWMGFFVMSWRMLRKEISKIATDLSLFDSAMIYIFLLAAFNPIGYVFEVVFAVFFIVPIWSVTIRINGKELSRTN
jgi:hypothetical protein